MGRYEKILLRLLNGSADANTDFDTLCQLLKWLGFEERIRGSHHIFRKPEVEERLNLQRDESNAKAYQVRQVRAIILKYRLGINEE